jgi:putative peptidoglycan lipid II flippase
MAFATLISRITGFIRIVLLAAILGAALSSVRSRWRTSCPISLRRWCSRRLPTAIFVPVLARAERDDPTAAGLRPATGHPGHHAAGGDDGAVGRGALLVRLMLGDDPKVDQPLTTAFAYLLLPQVIFYGLSSVFMAILNNRNVFSAPAWAPVVNNVVAIATLGLFVLCPGTLGGPVRMGSAKLMVLGIGTTLGVVAQTVR